MEDKTSKPKKGVRRVAKAAGSPIPCGPTGGAMDDAPSACGHSACTGGVCNVRYVGPTTPLRDHHIVHAARQASHVWSAAIVTGLAIVLTGALGYAAIGAEGAGSGGSMYAEFQQLHNQLDRIEKTVKTLLDRCESGTCGQGTQTPSDQDQCIDKCKKEYGDNVEKTNACIQQRCRQAAEQPAPTQEQCRASCQANYATLDASSADVEAMVKACMERNCPTAPAADGCTLQCKTKYKDDQESINKCLVENKCPGAPTTGGDNSQCISQCKEKYRDNLEGVNSCLKESCGVMPQTMLDDTAGQTGGVSVEKCQAACFDTRVACFSKAGTNITALRTCAAAETTCKKACVK